MDPDLSMIIYYEKKMMKNFLVGVEMEMPEFASVPPDSVEELRLGEILECAVDFHCYPQIINQLECKFPQFGKIQIHSCIWECSSKTNTRCQNLVEDEDAMIWNVIKDETNALQRDILHNFAVARALSGKKRLTRK